MRPEKQRIAIAEACGWRSELRPHPFDPNQDAPKDCEYWWHAMISKHGFGINALPDYLNDLNAMREAEKEILRGEMWTDYCDEVERATRFEGRMIMERRRLVHATAAQRAEAFLRTIGKWEE